MKIAVICANGKEGRLIVKEALDRGLDVTAVVRGDNKSAAASMAAALDDLRSRDDVNWTYISPAGDFQPDGPRTGKYLLGGEELLLNSRGESAVSYRDYAIALVDELISGAHPKSRISVVSQ